MWIARNKDLSLWAYKYKPKKQKKSFSSKDINYTQISNFQLEIFGVYNPKSLTFENSPIEIEVKVKQ